MKIHFVTIVLDGMPWIAHHLPVFNRLGLDWHWHIVEGVAGCQHCTGWCRPLDPRLSIDGTTEYLESIRSHKRVSLYQREYWNGKIEMVNAPLLVAQGAGLVWEIDADEIWTDKQIYIMSRMFEDEPSKQLAQFKCRYFFGNDIVITTLNTYGNHFDYEWYRAWRWKPGMKFLRHEPPEMDGATGDKFDHIATTKVGLVFDHYAYANESAVAFKEYYYGYDGAVKQWKDLQANQNWPVRLGDFCKWVKDETMVTRL